MKAKPIICVYFIADHDEFTIQLRQPGPKKDKGDYYSGSLWSICWQNKVLNRDGEFEIEPTGPCRAENFIRRTRFSLDDCIRRIGNVIEKDEKLSRKR